MTHDEFRLVRTGATAAGDAEAVGYLKQAIASGKHWYPALLGAVGLWMSAEETYDGRKYVYLIDGEAFDWLLLAERLLDALGDFIPENEKEALLFHGIPPFELSVREVKELIGDIKYGMYLNYFYGITVEEALQLAVQEEVDKDRHVQGLGRYSDTSGEAWRRIYNADKDALLDRFRMEKRLPKRASMTLDEMKQFTYWLFKYRFKRSEKARIASDTKKALDYLKRQWHRKGLSRVLAVDLTARVPD